MGIPALNNWFSGGSVTALLPTVLGAVFGMVALPAGMLEEKFWALMGLSVLVSLIVWWNSARQDQSAEAEARALRGAVDALSDKLAEQGTLEQQVDATVDLQPWPSPKLKKLVADVITKMRAMEHANHAARDRLIYQRDRTDWSDFADKFSAISTEHINRWRTDLQPVAVAVWKEMQRRIYGAPPYPRAMNADISLEYGMLSGVSPLSDAALALESLARQLPD